MSRTSTPQRASNLLTTFLLACMAAALSACGGGGGGSTPVAEAMPAAAGGFRTYTPVATVIGGRTLEAKCSGALPGNPEPYTFWARRGSVNKLAVFFDGGGACWDSATCSFPMNPAAPPGTPGLYKAEISASDDPSGQGGMFELNNDQNPVKDWTIVFVPYCTADLHGGSKTAEYTNVQTQKPFTIEHRGADNFALLLRWMADNISNPDEMLVSGSSAGAYGAMINYPKQVRSAFGSAKNVLFADSGQGVVSQTFDDARAKNWKIELDPAVWGANGNSAPTSELIGKLVAHYPNDRIAQYTSSLDLVQTQFYDVMANGLQGSNPGVCQAWTDNMLAGLAANQKQKNFSSYLAAGVSHTLLRGTDLTSRQPSDAYYTDHSAGVPFNDWFSGQLGSAPASNVACTDCTTLPMACPD